MDSISLNRFNALLLFFILLVVALYFGRLFLVPFTFGTLLAMLLVPVCRWLEKHHINRVPAVFISLFLVLLFIIGLFAIISAQIVNFSNELPQMQQRLGETLNTLQKWVEQQLGVEPQKQIQLLKKAASNLFKSANSQATALVSGVVGGFTNFAIVVIYVFFLLWKREKYESFVLQLTEKEHHSQVKDTLYEITKVASEYLGGRLLSMAMLAVIYVVGFSIIGLKNAVLLGLIAVIPTIIPYVGPLIGAFFPLVMALTSGDTGAFVPVVLVLVAAQAMDNYFIEPFVLGSNLSLSPFMTIVSIVIGELIWGVAGMILFIPLFAIIKIVCDHIPVLQPYGFLLGEDDDGKPAWIDKIKKLLKKK
ncbi:AI-2E family transporter [Adhaeribacter arboris]|uniref:AI-2E family transporter n=1 Tax=Adhaeribacter arboris TaxID=2072846 RepID=A0A2T2Y9Y2_9BACT|nr:AI-2E family transporter [Adhaeribacter arboris]PSR52313.1 AI-2E family transporter [Adhaeribacter arboris]